MAAAATSEVSQEFLNTLFMDLMSGHKVHFVSDESDIEIEVFKTKYFEFFSTNFHEILNIKDNLSDSCDGSDESSDDDNDDDNDDDKEEDEDDEKKTKLKKKLVGRLQDPDDVKIPKSDTYLYGIEKLTKYLIDNYTGSFYPWFWKTLESLVKGIRYGFDELEYSLSQFVSKSIFKIKGYSIFTALKVIYDKIRINWKEVVEYILDLDFYKLMDYSDFEDNSRSFEFRAMIIIYLQSFDSKYNPETILKELIPEWDSIEPKYWEEISEDGKYHFLECFKYAIEEAKTIFHENFMENEFETP
jgi:hypothetical protein